MHTGSGVDIFPKKIYKWPKNTKRSSIALADREIQIKTTTYLFISVRVAK